ncbi:MAG: hypothetical protein ACKVN9_10755 [Methylophilaceae bacterium]
MKKIILLCCLLPMLAHSADAEPSVEANIVAMDTDRDGMVSVAEIKAYLQKEFGPHYKESLLEKMDFAAKAQSCDSSFTRPFRQ